MWLAVDGTTLGRSRVPIEGLPARERGNVEARAVYWENKVSSQKANNSYQTSANESWTRAPTGGRAVASAQTRFRLTGSTGQAALSIQARIVQRQRGLTARRWTDGRRRVGARHTWAFRLSTTHAREMRLNCAHSESS